MTDDMYGVTGEDRIDLSKEETKQIRKRSYALLKSLLKPEIGRFVFTSIIVVVASVANTAGPMLIAIGIDWGIPQLIAGDFGPIAFVVTLMVASAIVAAWLTAYFTILAAKISQAVMLDLRKRVFKHTQNLGVDFHERYTSGRIISRQTSDLDAIAELLNGGITNLVSGLLYMIFVFIATIFIDPVSGIVLAVSLIPLAFLTRWFSTQSAIAYREIRTSSAKVIVHFVETMSGIRAVKTFRTGKRDRAKYSELVEEYRQRNNRAIRLFGFYDPALEFIGAVSVALIVLLGGLRVIDGSLEVGVLLAAMLYARRFFDPMVDMSMFFNGFQSSASALEKISGVLEEKPTVVDPTTPIDLWVAKGALDFEGVSFSYRGDKEILPKFDMQIPAGQTVALVGATGAGKSTLAKLVSRFYDPTEGVIKLDGIDLRKLHPKDLRRAVVMVTQESYLFSGSVAENIALGKPDATLEEIVAAASAVGAHEFISAMPEGYDTQVNKRGGRVSAGQRQLISFARAFLANPSVLILDEATASLDIPSERLVQDAMSTLLKDRTAIIIAHRLSTVAIADRVLVMDAGAIVEDGSPSELIAGTGRFAKLHQAWRDSLV